MKKQWYESLFENYGQKPYTKGTSRECDFIEKEIKFDIFLKMLKKSILILIFVQEIRIRF